MNELDVVVQANRAECNHSIMLSKSLQSELRTVMHKTDHQWSSASKMQAYVSRHLASIDRQISNWCDNFSEPPLAKSHARKDWSSENSDFEARSSSPESEVEIPKSEKQSHPDLASLTRQNCCDMFKALLAPRKSWKCPKPSWFARTNGK